MTAAAESIRVSLEAGRDVRATSALEAAPAGEQGRTAAFRPKESRPPNIADRYAVVLQSLSPRQRQGVVAALSVGFYDGWRPTREELAAYVAVKFGVTVTAPPHPSPR